MALAPAVTDIEQLKGHPAVARLVGWNQQAVEGVKMKNKEKGGKEIRKKIKKNRK